MPANLPAKHILDCSNATIMLLDTQGMVDYISPTLTQQLGSTCPQIGQSLSSQIAELSNLSQQPTKCERNTQTYLVTMQDCDGNQVLNWQNISAPITLSHALSNQMEHFRQGHFDVEFEPNSNNQAVVKMGTMINGCFTKMNSFLGELDTIIAQMADCDLSMDMSHVHSNSTLHSNLVSTLSNLSAAIRQATTVAETIGQVSGEIHRQNDVLAQRTADQASFLQSTSASMEELESTLQQNQDYVSNAVDIAQQASEEANLGSQSVQNVVNVINDIGSSSNKITGIIEVIDQIAFQTNLLALNASVEAARAGEHGRGFAVVAQEVRALAQRSAESAKEITQLIENANAVTKQGEEVASSTADNINKIVESVHSMAGLIREIGTATKEQGRGVQSANSAIIELDNITQQNSELANDLFKYTQRLDGEAGHLKDAVSLFKLNSNDLNHPHHQAAHDLVQEGVRRVGQALEQAVNSGRISMHALFNFDYKEIPGTNPTKYSTQFDGLCDEILPPIQEDLLQQGGFPVFIICADPNGYVPTHNDQFCQPLTGNYDVDFVGNRTKRLFTDRVGISVGQHEEKYKLQTYRRDTGELMFDLSAPIYVNGQHWGGMRCGYRIEAQQ